MEFFDIAAAAAVRWRDRAPVRSKSVERIRAGRVAEVESPERIRLRLSRLADNARKAAAPPATRTLVESIGLERVIGRPDFLDMNFVELALAVARFVGRINIRTEHGRSVGYGTGFMVSPRLLMTNNHVLPDADIARYSLVEFDFQNDRTGRPLPVVGFALEPAAFFMTDAALDFSLVAVSETSAGGAALQRYGWSRLLADEGKALLGEPLNIIQHPQGGAKQIVLRSNELVDLFDQYAHYVTDTEPGSSGSPVYNDQWEVVALHHSGVPRQDSEGNYIANDGSIWTDGMDPDKLAWVANEGIRVSSLVEHIRRQPLSGLQAQLRQDLLMLEPPSPLEAAAASQASIGGVRALSGPGGVIGPPQVSNGAASWTIPLHVSVQLGERPGEALPGAAPAAPIPVAPPVGGAPPAADPELDEALAELERAATRPYYDAADDQRKREAYYRGIDPSMEPAALYAALRDLLESTHTRPLGYKPAQHLYPWVDLHPPGQARNIVSIYSGKGFSARELIEADFAILRSRALVRESLREALRRPGVDGLESTVDEDALEAALPFNCEHVVPQSWFNKRDPMRGDLHHLFACEVRCNSFRGNYPYADFPDFSEVIRGDCGKREESHFEPLRGKGPVARATLYFLLRYPGEINRTQREYQEDAIPVLLAWHEADPVTDYERHRNAAIFEKQGSRNPLVDYPEWSGRIDFTQGLG